MPNPVMVYPTRVCPVSLTVMDTKKITPMSTKIAGLSFSSVNIEIADRYFTRFVPSIILI